MELEKCLNLVIPVFRRILRISVTVLYSYHNIVIIHLITSYNVIQVAQRLLIVDQLIVAIAITSPHLHTHTHTRARSRHTHAHWRVPARSEQCRRRPPPPATPTTHPRAETTLGTFTVPG